MTFKGVTFTLVDVPGFNDTEIPESDILALIGNWLKVSYTADRKLSGIIYLHKISDNRMYGTAMRNLRMFRQLCGEDCYKNVILATTHWLGSTPTDIELKRQQELVETKDFWGFMVSRGSQYRRFDNTQQSAFSLLDLVLGLERCKLQMQEEMVGENKDVKDTSAGKILEGELEKLKEQFAKEKEDMKAQAKLERDQEIKAMMEAAKADAAAKLEKVIQEQNKLMEQRLSEQMKKLQEQQQQQPQKQPSPQSQPAYKPPTAHQLWVAVDSGSSATVGKLLRDGADADAQDPNDYNRNALHKASWAGHAGMIPDLLSYTQGINAQDNIGFSALHMAAKNGYLRVVQLILNKSPNTETRDRSGRTPLHAAAYWGFYEIVKTLLEHHARVTPKDQNGRTPRDRAKREGHNNIVELLRRYE